MPPKSKAKTAVKRRGRPPKGQSKCTKPVRTMTKTVDGESAIYCIYFVNPPGMVEYDTEERHDSAWEHIKDSGENAKSLTFHSKLEKLNWQYDA